LWCVARKGYYDMLEYLTLRPQPVGSPLDASLCAFLLDLEARRCTPKTLQHYRYTVGGFIRFLEAQGVVTVEG